MFPACSAVALIAVVLFCPSAFAVRQIGVSPDLRVSSENVKLNVALIVLRLEVQRPCERLHIFTRHDVFKDIKSKKNNLANIECSGGQIWIPPCNTEVLFVRRILQFEVSVCSSL